MDGAAAAQIARPDSRSGGSVEHLENAAIGADSDGFVAADLQHDRCGADIHITIGVRMEARHPQLSAGRSVECDDRVVAVAHADYSPSSRIDRRGRPGAVAGLASRKQAEPPPLVSGGGIEGDDPPN